MARPLPYPGFSWSFAQHAAGLKPVELYKFLMCAAPFEGEQSGSYDEKITKLMIAYDVLTPNKRDGKPDAWRDYQQLLAELGLIYSTMINHSLKLTEAGHMFLAGELGFSELIGIQALRYQYPNGQKSTISKEKRSSLKLGGITTPENLTEVQATSGVLIKPGTLILRILISLSEAGHEPRITTSECQAFLLPCRTNAEWTTALSEILAHRQINTDITNINRGTRRNIQEWLKFLRQSDLFESDGAKAIWLSDAALANLAELKEICCEQEAPSTFWIPDAYDIQTRLTWFDWFGHLPFNTQKLLQIAGLGDEYIERNYFAGTEEEGAVSPDMSSVSLRLLDLNNLGRDAPFAFSGDIEALAESLLQGAQKRHAKTLLHDRIIKELAEIFIAQGASVEFDPDSIDLFSVWPSGKSAIFEVKTVTRRSLQGRLRTAIGQVEEYAYRRQRDGAGVSDRVVVVNTELDSEAWQIDFLNNYLDIGLICKPAASYSAFAPKGAVTKEHWLKLGS